MPTIGNNLLPYPNTSDEPNMPKAISDLASAIDTAIGGGARIYQTLAALQAVPSAQLFDGMRAHVVNDPTASNNGVYTYTSGVWAMGQHMVLLTHGIIAHGIPAGNEWSATGVFPTPFKSAPAVWAIATTPSFVCGVKDVSTTGYQVRVKSSADTSDIEQIYVYAYGA